MCDQISPLHCTVPPRQACCLALQQARQVHCEVVLFAQFPLGRASFNTQPFAEVWRLTNSGMWDLYCPHIDTYMYRVSSAEFLPHSIAHKLAGMSLVLVMSYVKICCPLAKTLCLDCIACNKKNYASCRSCANC